MSVMVTPVKLNKRSKSTFDPDSDSDSDSEETSAIKDHYIFSNNQPNQELVSVIVTPVKPNKRSKSTFDPDSDSDCDSEETSAIKDHYNFSNKKICLEYTQPSGSDHSSSDCESYEYRDSYGYKYPIFGKLAYLLKSDASDDASSDGETYVWFPKYYATMDQNLVSLNRSANFLENKQRVVSLEPPATSIRKPLKQV